jgi:hypothetical protein
LTLIDLLDAMEGGRLVSLGWEGVEAVDAKGIANSVLGEMEAQETRISETCSPSVVETVLWEHALFTGVAASGQLRL